METNHVKKFRKFCVGMAANIEKHDMTGIVSPDNFGIDHSNPEHRKAVLDMLQKNRGDRPKSDDAIAQLYIEVAANFDLDVTNRKPKIILNYIVASVTLLSLLSHDYDELTDKQKRVAKTKLLMQVSGLVGTPEILESVDDVLEKLASDKPVKMTKGAKLNAEVVAFLLATSKELSNVLGESSIYSEIFEAGN